MDELIWIPTSIDVGRSVAATLRDARDSVVLSEGKLRDDRRPVLVTVCNERGDGGDDW